MTQQGCKEFGLPYGCTAQNAHLVSFAENKCTDSWNLQYTGGAWKKHKTQGAEQTSYFYIAENTKWLVTNSNTELFSQKALTLETLEIKYREYHRIRQKN